MSKILQIERALLSLDQTTFQKLCAAYFVRQYPAYHVMEIGSSHGQNTTSIGTPDILIDLKSDKYYFAECTIQKKNRLEKFLKDISNCFDFDKAKIEQEKIELIILCHNTKALPPDQKQLLIKEIGNYGCKTEFIDIDTLKFALFDRHKGLAKDFLNIEIDTQQILEISDFIKEQERKATSLHNDFIGREKEIEDIKELLKSENIVVLTGNPGVGKTRLAIEMFSRFNKENTDYRVFGIDNKGISLWNDLQVHFIDNHKYLLLVDDANRIKELENILRLVYSEGSEIKIIITLRDYASEKVISLLEENNYAFAQLKIEKLSDDIIKDILTSLGITNTICVNNIKRIADGNPRLVMMASNFVLESNNCNKLRNVTDIYDKYFKKSINEINHLNDKTTLKTLGILCFFRTISKINVPLNERIFETFKISESEFWESINKLYKIELVEVYGNELAKISDQTVATYFFYYVFIKEQILEFNCLLNEFLDEFSGKMMESLYPVLSYFEYKRVMDVIDKSIDDKYEKSSKNEESFIVFIKVFWFCRKAKVLLWIKSQINQIEAESIENISFSLPKQHWDTDLYLDLIRLFGEENDDHFLASLEILFEYVMKRPVLMPQVIQYFTHDLSLDTLSHLNAYKTQSQLFGFLYGKSKEFELANRIIIAISEHFLNFEYRTHGGSRKKLEVSVTTLWIGNDNGLLKIRENIWKFLMDKIDNYPKEILGVLKKYISDFALDVLRNPKMKGIDKVFEYDKDLIIKLFSEKFDRDNFQHCLLVYEYQLLLIRKKEDIKPFRKLFSRFTNKTFEIAVILNWSYYKRKEDIHFVRGNYQEMKEKELSFFFQNYDIKDYKELLLIIEELREYDSSIDWNYSFNLVIYLLIKRNEKLGLGVLNELFKSGNKIRFISTPIVRELLNSKQSTKALFDIIQKFDFLNKQDWELDYYHSLPPDRINSKTIKELLEVYKGLPEDRWLFFDFLDKYKIKQGDILVKIIKVLLEKTDNSKFKWWSYEFLEKYYSELIEYPEILKKLYLYFHSVNTSPVDQNGEVFKTILELDNNFIVDFISIRNKDNHYISSHENRINFDFIWNMKNYKSILLSVFELFEERKFHSIDQNHFLNKFFPKGAESSKVAKFIEDYLKRNYSDKFKVRLIFDIITSSYPNSRVKYLIKFYTLIGDIKPIQGLNLTHRDGRVLYSSDFSIHREDKYFWQEVEKGCQAKSSLLELLIWANDQQKNCDLAIEHEIKRKFLYDD